MGDFQFFYATEADSGQPGKPVLIDNTIRNPCHLPIDVMDFSQGRYIRCKWCPGPESNRHGRFQPRDFKSLASTNFATRAAMRMIICRLNNYSCRIK